MGILVNFFVIKDKGCWKVSFFSLVFYALFVIYLTSGSISMLRTEDWQFGIHPSVQIKVQSIIIKNSLKIF